MRRLSSIVTACSAVVCFAVSPARAETAVEFPDLSLSQSAAFKGGVESAFGHVLGLKIGSVELAADLQTENPMTKKKDAAVGILASYGWNGGLKGVMNFTFNVSAANKKKLDAALKTAPMDLTAEIDYRIYAYDSKAKGFYIATKSFTIPQRGILNKTAKDLPSMKLTSLPLQCVLKKTDVTVSDSPSEALSKPVTYVVHLAVLPGGKKQQHVIFATDSGTYEQLSWGLPTAWSSSK